jgi:hypothetical protein
MLLHFNAGKPVAIAWKGLWLLLGIAVTSFGIRSRRQRSLN